MFNNTTTLSQEIQEAQEAGVRALNSLRKAQRCLDSARNWGMLDIFGGGMITTLLKHSRMDDAQQCVQQAQWDLRRFSQELSDVHLPQIELNGFASFADIFFDGLWADLFVQQKINAARRQLEEASRRVEDILYQLRQMQ